MKRTADAVLPSLHLLTRIELDALAPVDLLAEVEAASAGALAEPVAYRAHMTRGEIEDSRVGFVLVLRDETVEQLVNMYLTDGERYAARH